MAVTTSGNPIINDVRHWRRRAQEARALAEHVRGEDAQATMLEIAAEYERIAALARQRAVSASLD
jgi:hypothetical protein